MKAFVIEAENRFGIRDDVRLAAVGPRDVRVGMRAAGVCRTDEAAVLGKWPTRLPCVNGHEGAGVVLEVGARVTDRAVGEHVVVGARMCGRCYFCTRSQPWFCVTKDIGGAEARFELADGTPVGSMVGKGTWAEELIVSADAAIPVPDAVPFDVAALLGCAVAAGVGQVIRLVRPAAGSSAVIFGGGAVGAAAVMGARLVGCSPIVVVEPSRQKHPVLIAVGATHAIVPDELPEAIAELTGGRGFDSAFENVGQAAVLRTAWDSVRRGGTLAVSGVGGREAAVTFDMNELAVEGKTLIGNFSGGLVPARDIAEYCELYLAGRLDLEALITHRLGFDDLPGALAALDTDPTVLRQVVVFEPTASAESRPDHV